MVAIAEETKYSWSQNIQSLPYRALVDMLALARIDPLNATLLHLLASFGKLDTNITTSRRYSMNIYKSLLI